MKKKIQKIHFVGIKGVGMTPLALLAKEAGCKITGSDIADQFITDAPLKKAKIVPFVGFSKDHIKKTDLVITTGAHGGFENEEVIAAKEKGIGVITQGQAVGVFMEGTIFGRKDIEGISVTGTHGKTTTTGMIATLLYKAGLRPSYIIGTSSFPSLPSPGHFGKGKYFVAEADEYATEPVHDKTPKFLWQHPKIAVITNIELDHPDVYASVDDMRAAFLKFVQNIPPKGVLIACIDDPQVRFLVKAYTGEVITYGFSEGAMYHLTRVTISGTQTFFQLETNNTLVGDFTIKLTGEHNALNATATIITGLQVGLPIESIKKILPEYRGSKRRLEYIGESENGLLIYDDYAHHPTEIKKTLKALKRAYPTSRIVCLFQPHTYSRTKRFFKEFTTAFPDVDQVILTSIYASLREGVDSSVSSEQLVKEIGKTHKAVGFLPKATDMVEYIRKNHYRSGTVIITMGAGDIYKITDQLLSL